MSVSEPGFSVTVFKMDEHAPPAHCRLMSVSEPGFSVTVFKMDEHAPPPPPPHPPNGHPSYNFQGGENYDGI